MSDIIKKGKNISYLSEKERKEIRLSIDPDSIGFNEEKNQEGEIDDRYSEEN